MIKLQGFSGPVEETTISWWNEAANIVLSSIAGVTTIPAKDLSMTMNLRVKDKATGTIVTHAITQTELPELLIPIGQQHEWALTDLLITLGYTPNATSYDCSMRLDMGGLPEEWLHGTVKMSLGADGTAVRLIG